VKQWKTEMNNMGKMAIWLKFRYEACKENPKSDDAKKYRAYRRHVDEKKAAELYKKTQTHDEWTLNSLYEKEDGNPRLLSFNLDSDIARINGEYIEWVGEEFNQRPVFHSSGRDTYMFFERGRWQISTTDPRFEEPEIFLVSSRNIPMSNFRRGDEQTWTIGPKGIEELEMTEESNKNAEVMIKRADQIEMSQISEDSEDTSTRNLRDKLNRESNFEAMSLEKCERGHWGVRGWYKSEVTGDKVDLLWHKQRKMNEVKRLNLATDPYPTNRQHNRILQKLATAKLHL